MENASLIFQAISSIGFPIVISCLLLWYTHKRDEKQDQRNAEFVKAIENNTRAVDALTMEIKRS